MQFLLHSTFKMRTISIAITLRTSFPFLLLLLAVRAASYAAFAFWKFFFDALAATNSSLVQFANLVAILLSREVFYTEMSKKQKKSQK